MRKPQNINLLLLILFLAAVIATPVFSATSTSLVLPPDSIITQQGFMTGTVSSLGAIQQSNDEDDPATYVTFQTPSSAYLGYSVYQLPELIRPNTISAALLQVNFKGPAHAQQIWTWSIYDWNTTQWNELGNSMGTNEGIWNTLVFRVSVFSRYVSPEGEVRIRLGSNNSNGDAKLDYQALHFTYVPATATVAKPTYTLTVTKAGYVFPITHTPSPTNTPTNTPTPTNTSTPTNTFTPTVTRTSTPTKTNTPPPAGVARGPLFVNPDNPRYFTDGTIANGKYKSVYLTGSHTWCNLMDCDNVNPIADTFPYTAYLDLLQSKNHNFFRLWRAENARGGEDGDNFWFNPMPYVRVNQTNPFLGNTKFDLNQFNQAYFDRMRQRIIQAGNRGMYVSIMLFDGWSVETKFPSTHQPWKGHPYNPSNNVNNIDGDVNNDNNGGETHTLVNSEITALQEAYVRKVIDTVNDLDNVLYEISNESTGGTENRLWQYHMINYIKNYELTKPKQHPVGMTVPWPNGNNADLYASPAAWVSPNGNIDNPPLANGTRVILADTDHLCGICGNRQWVWKSFMRGENPIYMDFYDNRYSGRGIPFEHSEQLEIRNNLGYARSYALRMNLTAMTPTSNTSLCSTGYCLRNAVANGAEFLVYRPETSGNIVVNLSAVPASESLTVEWFNPATGVKQSGGTVVGGNASQSFSSPFLNTDVVLYIYDNTP